MGVGQAEDLNIDVSRLSPRTDKLYAAGGNELRCYGTVDCDMTLGEITAKVMVSVIQGLDGALLSWHDSIALGILPSSFPAQVARVGPPPAPADAPPPPIATPPPPPIAAPQSPIATPLPPPRRGPGSATASRLTRPVPCVTSALQVTSAQHPAAAHLARGRPTETHRHMPRVASRPRQM